MIQKKPLNIHLSRVPLQGSSGTGGGGQTVIEFVATSNVQIGAGFCAPPSLLYPVRAPLLASSGTGGGAWNDDVEVSRYSLPNLDGCGGEPRAATAKHRLLHVRTLT